MDRRMIVLVLSAALLGGAGLWLLLPEPVDDRDARLPWRTSLDPLGRLQVFGFTLGETTLTDVEQAFGASGKATLFAGPERAERRFALEVFFDQVYLNGLRADIVLTLSSSQDMLSAMFDRGRRISRLGDGTQKVTVAPTDEAMLRGLQIAHITYLPMARLDPSLLEDRFGEPTERLTEPSGIVHWLYPSRGLDLARDPQGRVVIQYVNPSEFECLRMPLLSASPAAPEA